MNEQVGHLGEDYEEWVHQPVVSKESPRLYENGFIEVYIIIIVNCLIYLNETQIKLSYFLI